MQCAHALQYFSRVPARIHAIFGVSYDTFPIDDERRPGHAETQLSVDLALAPDAIAPADLALEVRQQADGQTMLVAEICVGKAFVPAHTEHGTVAAPELLFQIAEFDGLGRTARRVVLGTEIQHHQVPAQGVKQIEQFQIGIRQFEQRSGLSCTEHAHLPFPASDRNPVIRRRPDSISGVHGPVKKAGAALHKCVRDAPESQRTPTDEPRAPRLGFTSDSIT